MKQALNLKSGPDWTSWLDLEVTDISELTNDHLRLAIGLESAHSCVIPSLLEHSTEDDIKHKKRKLVKKRVLSESEDDPIDISESGDDECGHKRKKGKQVARMRVKKCNKKGCEDNLLCFNHLGIEAVSVFISQSDSHIIYL